MCTTHSVILIHHATVKIIALKGFCVNWLRRLTLADAIMDISFNLGPLCVEKWVERTRSTRRGLTSPHFNNMLIFKVWGHPKNYQCMRWIDVLQQKNLKRQYKASNQTITSGQAANLDNIHTVQGKEGMIALIDYVGKIWWVELGFGSVRSSNCGNEESLQWIGQRAWRMHSEGSV